MHERPILLTGATGYIGSRLLRELEAGGYAVRCLARQPAGVPTARETFAIRPTTLREAFVRAIVARGLLRRIEEHAVRDSASPVVGTRIGNAHQRVAPRWAAAVALVAATTLQPAAAHPQTPPVRAVPFVDLDRYAGDWFEIARFPNRFQRQCVGDVRATYARRPDGRVDVVNRCRVADGETEARGVARVVDERTFAKLKVRFAPAWLSWLPMVWGDYWIIGLAPDYSWAVVGDPGRDYLWIHRLGLARPRRCAAAAHGQRLRGVTRRAPCSVLVVRRPCREFRRIVIGLDGSSNAARAVDFLAAVTPPRGGHVTVLTVVDTMHVPIQGLAPAGTRATVAAEVSRIDEGRRASARKDLSRAARVLSAAGWEVDQVVTEGAPLRELLAMVAKAHADLVIVGARGVTGLRHLLLGSVSEGALSASPVRSRARRPLSLAPLRMNITGPAHPSFAVRPPVQRT